MKFISTSTVVLSLLLAGSVRAAAYNVTDTFQGDGFFSGFSFFSADDPLHGRVNFVSEAQAQSLGLATVNGNSFILRADNTTTLSPRGPGRNSFRIISRKQWGLHVSVYDVKHMPQGCGTWPAVWEFDDSSPKGLGDFSPKGGEVDIIEGVNDQEPNTSSLRTGPGCIMPPGRDQTGTPTGIDCDAITPFDAGCGVETTEPNNYGPAFNKNGGGWYAMERTTTFIKIWFWPRDASNVPADVSNGSGSIDTSAWGKPTAFFPTTRCNIIMSAPSNIFISLTFCGDLAGFLYPLSGCPSSCIDFVNNNPGAFSNAYFDLGSVRVYQ